MRQLFIVLIKIYQRYISVFLPPSCRYLPTCSEYTFLAIHEYGLFKGLVMGICRICRCHPFCQGGDDPVPLNKLHHHQ